MLTRLLRTFTRPYLGTIIIVLSITVFQTWINLSLPSLNADLINQGVAQGDTEYVLQVGSQMLGLSVVLVAVSVFAVYLASKVAMSIARDLRSAIFDKVLRLSPYEMDLFGTPSLITRNTNDVQQVQMLLTVGLTMLASAPITVVGGVIMAIHHNAKLSILIAVAVPLMAGVIGVVMSKAVPEFRKVQKRIDRINGVFREQITGMRVIRAFTRDDFEKERFATANMDLMTTQLGINRLFAYVQQVRMFGKRIKANHRLEPGQVDLLLLQVAPRLEPFGERAHPLAGVDRQVADQLEERQRRQRAGGDAFRQPKHLAGVRDDPKLDVLRHRRRTGGADGEFDLDGVRRIVGVRPCRTVCRR